MELAFKKRLPEHLLDFLLPGVRALPAVKSCGPNDLIDVLEGASTWRTDETIPVGFGTILVVPVWRFLLEMEPRT